MVHWNQSAFAGRLDFRLQVQDFDQSRRKSASFHDFALALCPKRLMKSSNLCYTATSVFAKRGVLMEHTRIQERLCGIAGVSGSCLSEENRIGVMVHSGRPKVIARCQKKEEVRVLRLDSSKSALCYMKTL
ncbi:hypothetical protein C5167_042799 [Papaver somniferum]|uniref:Uncharacterized protein n=1 Tax=Papaver somniferum TaxID=3469 RepID=A0A4Y7L3V4_PAPSO|nr:hypothetical protein C5167_042799 [Papaver somniferum]